MVTLGSLFDGIGGWQLAAVRNGILPLWSSDIDEFCCQITRRHFPDTVQLGDINHIEIPSKVDIITAGSPCQDLSIAGKRSGINGERSGLFFKAVELVRRLKPNFFVWENVPGVLSSNGRLDFKAVLEEILQEPVPLPRHWSNAGLVDGRHCQIAWRLLDAQFWGVPQRRKRIFLVADFTGRRAAKILFESTSLRRNSPPCQVSQQSSAARIGSRFAENVPLKFSLQTKKPCAKLSLKTSEYHTARPKKTRFHDSTHGLISQGVISTEFAYGLGRDAFNQGANAKFNPTIEHELQPPYCAWCRRLCHAVYRKAAYSYRMRKTSRLAR